MKLRLAAGAAIVGLTCFAGTASGDEPPPAPAGPPPSAASAVPGPAAAIRPTTIKRTVWPWVLMGSGVALIVTAIVLEVNAVHEDDQAESANVKLTDYLQRPVADPDRQRLQGEVDDHKSSASSQRTAALVVGTAGVLTVAGSVVLWFYEGSKRGPAAIAPAARSMPTFRPALGPSYAGGQLAASF